MNREWFTAITEIIDAFCDERLDDEYAEICRYVAGKLARNRDCQVLRGKIPIWVSGIIYAVGQINFSLIHRLRSISRLRYLLVFWHKQKYCITKSKDDPGSHWDGRLLGSGVFNFSNDE